jgi:hypothetical protein
MRDERTTGEEEAGREDNPLTAVSWEASRSRGTLLWVLRYTLAMIMIMMMVVRGGHTLDPDSRMTFDFV